MSETASSGYGAPRADAATVLTVLVVLLLLMPSRLVFRPLGGVGTPANVLGVVLLGLWGLSRLSPSIRSGRGRQPIHAAAALLAIATLVSYASGMLLGWVSPVGIRIAGVPLGNIATPSPAHGFTATEISAADRGLISIAAWLGVLLFTADGLRNRERVEVLLRRFVLLGGLVAAVGIYQFFTAANISDYLHVPGLHVNADFGFVRPRSLFNRAASTAIDPIEFGVVMAAVFPLALHRALHAPRSRRVLPWVVVLLILLSIFMTVSRSGVLALVVGVAVMAAGWTPRRRLGLLIVAPGLLVATRVAIPGLVGTIGSLFTHLGTDPSTVARTARYPMALHLIAQAPVTGHGMSTFIAGYYTPMDNQFLLTTIEMGILGLLALLAVFGIGFFTARGARRRALDDESRHLAQALAASIASVCASFATFDAFSFPMAAMTVFLLVGCAGALWRSFQPRSSIRADGQLAEVAP